ncbi:hypothetical protein C0Q70_20763 [Pomacea canaliculata]|uniref:Uncharacterized protein n=1 Tax=Pomacea canaliculata TaxID=400727 RepID=A0A2T7NGI2_POMCA|nr:hypothetical protein C0Q70_20763 [Pomacea canaliculata]
MMPIRIAESVAILASVLLLVGVGHADDVDEFVGFQDEPLPVPFEPQYEFPDSVSIPVILLGTFQTQYSMSPVSVQYVSSLSTVCLQYVSSLSTVCLQTQYSMFPDSVQYVSSLSTVCLQSQYSMSPVCLQSQYSMSPVSVQFVSRLSTVCFQSLGARVTRDVAQAIKCPVAQ